MENTKTELRVYERMKHSSAAAKIALEKYVNCGTEFALEDVIFNLLTTMSMCCPESYVLALSRLGVDVSEVK